MEIFSGGEISFHLFTLTNCSSKIYFNVSYNATKVMKWNIDPIFHLLSSLEYKWKSSVEINAHHAETYNFSPLPIIHKLFMLK